MSTTERTHTTTPAAGVADARDRGGANAHRVARVTGLLYLGLGLTGMLGFLVVRPVLVGDDPAGTLAALQDHELLARVGIGLELGVVVTQALAALWFFRLFRPVDAFAAAAIAAFGLGNAVAVMVSAAAQVTALEVALGVGRDLAPDSALTAHALTSLSENLWGVGSVFFGLWLVPMGVCVVRSATMPRLLGRVLVVGGVGYVLSAFATYLLPDVPALAMVLVVPATVGEFWMIGHLLVRGAGRR